MNHIMKYYFSAVFKVQGHLKVDILGAKFTILPYLPCRGRYEVNIKRSWGLTFPFVSS